MLANRTSMERVSIGDDIIKEDIIRTEIEESGNGLGQVIPKPESIRDMTPEELQGLETQMVRKVDMVIMPIMGVLYLLNYVDRSALASAKVYGIMTDLNMTTNDFASAISILFAGYIPFQIPSNLLMSKISRPGLYICAAATVWGVVSGCTGAVRSYHGLLAIRVLLGATEAVFFPGVIYLMSAWYTKKELGKRLGALFIFQSIGSAFGGFIAAACLTLDGRYGIAGWRWLFIVCVYQFNQIKYSYLLTLSQRGSYNSRLWPRICHVHARIPTQSASPETHRARLRRLASGNGGRCWRGQ